MGAGSKPLAKNSRTAEPMLASKDKTPDEQSIGTLQGPGLICGVASFGIMYHSSEESHSPDIGAAAPASVSASAADPFTVAAVTPVEDQKLTKCINLAMNNGCHTGVRHVLSMYVIQFASRVLRLKRWRRYKIFSQQKTKKYG